MTDDSKRKYLFIINDGPYGNERPYNALRLAMNLVKEPAACVQVFLMGTASTAHRGQKTPNGYYNVERMLHASSARAKSPPEGPVQRPAGSGQNGSSRACSRGI